MGSKVLIINTGGTLSSVARQHGLAPGLTTDSMLKELHIVAGEAELSTLEFSSLDSANIFPEDWAELARLISENRKRADGIVVIHGTDTLAYTSSMLSFMLQNIQIPVVITGRWPRAGARACLWPSTGRSCWDAGPPRCVR